MFVSVLLGDGRVEMFNLNCKLINFIRHLKQRCGVDVRECVDLMDACGRLMNLQEKQDSMELASGVLVERQRYILLRVCRGAGTGAPQYVPLPDSVSQSHPEFTELLRKVTSSEKERRSRGGRAHRTRRHDKH